MGAIVRDPLIRLLAVNWLAGFAVTVILVGGLYVTDAGGLWSLILRSEQPAVPIAMLFAGFLITFTSAAMGTAVMSLTPQFDGGRGDECGGRRQPCAAARPVPTAARVFLNQA